MTKAKELREGQRFPFRIRVDYKSKEIFLFEYSENLSTSGIFLNTPEPLVPGTHLELQFTPEGGDEIISVAGEVIWVNAGKDSTKPGMGIKFVDINKRTREKITNLVRRLAVL